MNINSTIQVHSYFLQYKRMNLTNGDMTRSLPMLIDCPCPSLFCVHNKLLVWIRDFNLHKLGLKCKCCQYSCCHHCSLLTSLRTLTPESRPWWAESNACPLSGLDTLPRPDFCLACVRMCDFRLVDWANFLLQPWVEVWMTFTRTYGKCLPQMDTRKAYLQCVFAHVFSNWSLKRIACHSPRMCTENVQGLE